MKVEPWEDNAGGLYLREAGSPEEGWAWAANAPGVPLPNGPRMVADIDAAAGAEAEVRLTPGDTWVFGGDPGTAAARYLGLPEEVSE